MAETIFRGPDVNAGSLLDGRVEPFDGPTIGYQAGTIPDPRYSPMLKDGLSPGRVPTWLNSPYIVMVDCIPSAFSTTSLASGQIVTGSSVTGVTLATTQPTGTAGVPVLTPNVPILLLGSTTVTTAIALDFGFSGGTTTANSSAVVVNDNTIFNVGQWLCIGGGLGTSPAKVLFTQVMAIGTAIGTAPLNNTTIFVNPLPTTTLTGAPIGDTNLYSQLLPPGTQFGPASTVPTYVNPYSLAGLASVFNPLETLARNICVQGNTSVATAAFKVTGADIYGQPMSELITASGTTAIFGKKAFKYIFAVVPSTAATTGTYSFGVGDVMGFHIRSDRWEYSNIFYNGAFATNQNGWTAGTTAPPTATTGDVRGTIQLSTAGSLATSVIAGVTNGTSRFTLMMSVPLFNIISATPTTTAPLVGRTQT